MWGGHPCIPSDVTATRHCREPSSWRDCTSQQRLSTGTHGELSVGLPGRWWLLGAELSHGKRLQGAFRHDSSSGISLFLGALGGNPDADILLQQGLFAQCLTHYIPGDHLFTGRSTAQVSGAAVSALLWHRNSPGTHSKEGQSRGTLAAVLHRLWNGAKRRPSALNPALPGLLCSAARADCNPGPGRSAARGGPQPPGHPPARQAFGAAAPDGEGRRDPSGGERRAERRGGESLRPTVNQPVSFPPCTGRDRVSRPPPPPAPPRPAPSAGRPHGTARRVAAERRGRTRCLAWSVPSGLSGSAVKSRHRPSERRPGPSPQAQSGADSPRPSSQTQGRIGCAARHGPVPAPQKRPCAGPIIANHQSPLITADEAGGGGAFPGADRAGGSGELCPAGAGAEGGTRP